MRRSLCIRASLVAMQLCGKHISAAVNQQAAIEEAVFTVDPPLGYITSVSIKSNHMHRRQTS
jgi:hypothetical protein